MLNPTRCRGEATASVLDLVFTRDEDDAINSIELSAALGKSDHCVVEVTLSLIAPEFEKEILLYDKADYIGMKDFMSIDWEDALSSMNSVESQWQFFCDKYSKAVQEFVPRRKIKHRKKE